MNLLVVFTFSGERRSAPIKRFKLIKINRTLLVEGTVNFFVSIDILKFFEYNSSSRNPNRIKSGLVPKETLLITLTFESESVIFFYIYHQN